MFQLNPSPLLTENPIQLSRLLMPPESARNRPKPMDCLITSKLLSKAIILLVCISAISIHYFIFHYAKGYVIQSAFTEDSVS